jgi:hypothetical protein
LARANAAWSYGQNVESLPQLAVLLKFDIQPPPAVVEFMQREVEKSWSRPVYGWRGVALKTTKARSFSRTLL